jgi:hypothetical protein
VYNNTGGVVFDADDFIGQQRVRTDEEFGRVGLYVLCGGKRGEIFEHSFNT